jgi:uncharacterized protein YggT (Ycf19 family)
MPPARGPRRRALAAPARRHLALAVVLVLGAALRLAYLPVDVGVVDQSGGQVELAHNILHSGHWFAENLAEVGLVKEVQERKHHTVDPTEVDYARADAHPRWRPFVYEVTGPGLVLAGVWSLAPSERLLYGKLFQIAIDLAMVLLVYRIALLLFARPRAALLAAALYALCPPIARQSTIVDPDIWGLDFTLVILALYLQVLRSGPGWGRRLEGEEGLGHRQGLGGARGRWLLACSVAIGLGAYFRPNVLLLPIAFALAGVAWLGASRVLRDALAMLAVAVLLLLPWTIHNWIDFHRIIPTRVGLGTNLWEGLGEIHNDFGALNDDQGTYEEIHRVRPDLANQSPAYDEYLEQRALHAIAQHPLFYAEVLARRVALSTVAMYESAWMYNGGESPVRYRANTGRGLFSYVVHRPFQLLESGLEAAIFVLAMLALAFTWRGRRRQHLLLIAVLVSAMLPYWLLHFETRYALPTLPIYLLWIALAADLLGERTLRRVRARPPRLAPARGR